jgi:gamma-glutamyl hercynylcysteine S-oxide synthase
MNIKKIFQSFTFFVLTGFSLQAAADDPWMPFFQTDQQIYVPSCTARGVIWEGEYIPCSESKMNDWFNSITHARDERRIRIGYNDEIWKRYSFPEFKWTQSSYMQAQMMIHDRYFYDPLAKQYTVSRYLKDLKDRFGGIDAVLIWPSYPNMGIDDRNQLDMIRSMPGGIAGVKQIVEDFHKANVRVLFPMMMWDQGTRKPDEPWSDAIASMMKELNVDGVNGDTQDGVPLSFSLAAEKINHPLVFQPEGSPADEALAWNVMTWGQFKFPFAPLVSRYKWLDTRHMVNISHRWNRNKKDDLQYAFFNGIGWESWENIWGIWNGITARDGEATRRVATIERGVAPFLISPDWQPHYPVLPYGVFASRWPLKDEAVYTIVNRNEYDVKGEILSLPDKPGMRYFDLYHGRELLPQKKDKDKAVLSFEIEKNGFGAILTTPNEPDTNMKALLKTMYEMTLQPLSQFKGKWQPLLQKMVEVTRITFDTAPEDMVEIPGGDFEFQVTGTEIEGEDAIGVDVQYPWEDAPRRAHTRINIKMDSYYIDKTPVTNAQFKKFLDNTNYHPADDENFLKDWKNGLYPAGWDNKPVTWVSLDDARAYAAWAHKRLPHEWEWQYAAQGKDGRLYPWGETWDPNRVPAPNKTRALTSPDDVNAHPDGASPFGVLDMTGNVWQMTDEFTDEHTRAVVLRGGSYYQPQGSIWYFPQAYKNILHSKYLLMASSYDRSGTIGFRCVRDK